MKKETYDDIQIAKDLGIKEKDIWKHLTYKTYVGETAGNTYLSCHLAGRPFYTYNLDKGSI